MVARIDLPEPRPISLRDATQLALDVLLQAEQRRQAEREREAAYWAALDESERSE